MGFGVSGRLSRLFQALSRTLVFAHQPESQNVVSIVQQLLPLFSKAVSMPMRPASLGPATTARAYLQQTSIQQKELIWRLSVPRSKEGTVGMKINGSCLFKLCLISLIQLVLLNLGMAKYVYIGMQYGIQVRLRF